VHRPRYRIGTKVQCPDRYPGIVMRVVGVETVSLPKGKRKLYITDWQGRGPLDVNAFYASELVRYVYCHRSSR